MRRDDLYLTDMQEAAKKVVAIVGNRTRADWQSDFVLVDATIRNLQVIGEAARSVSDGTRALAPEIEWKRLVGLRNILVHQYFGLDEDIVWDLATNRCLELDEQLVALLERLERS